MYTSGFKKEYNFALKKATRTNKVSSAIPLILRDMGPPGGSVFDPRMVWGKMKDENEVSYGRNNATTTTTS